MTDHTLPSTDLPYADFVAAMHSRINEIAAWLDPAFSDPTGLSIGAKRIVPSNDYAVEELTAGGWVEVYRSFRVSNTLFNGSANTLTSPGIYMIAASASDTPSGINAIITVKKHPSTNAILQQWERANQTASLDIRNRVYNPTTGVWSGWVPALDSSHLSASDPHPQYMTEAESDAAIAAAIAALVDSSPGTLDTLNELAAALGDDPNFATTVSAALAARFPYYGSFSGDVHTLTTRGFYDINSAATNKPFGVGGTLLVMVIGGNVTHLLFRTSNTSAVEVWSESFGITSGWTDWDKLPTLTDVNALIAASVASTTVAGVVALSTDAVAKAKASASVALTPSNLAALAFTSSEIAMPTASGNKSAAHGLGAVPASIEVAFRCKTAEHGYAVGDEIVMTSMYGYYSEVWTAYKNSTDVGVAFLTAEVNAVHKTAGTWHALTAANWRVVLRASLI
jgi:hypothetical protein